MAGIGNISELIRMAVEMHLEPVVGFIEAEPLVSVGVAFVLGVLVGVAYMSDEAGWSHDYGSGDDGDDSGSDERVVAGLARSDDGKNDDKDDDIPVLF